MATNKNIQNKQDKRRARVAGEEKIVNSFLIQLTYSILASIALLFVYNGRMFKYGNNIGLSMQAIIWSFFALFLVVGMIFLVLWNTKKKEAYKTIAIYMFITAAGFFWCIGPEKIAGLFHMGSAFPGAQKMMKALFMIIGLSVVGELILYAVRMRKLKK